MPFKKVTSYALVLSVGLFLTQAFGWPNVATNKSANDNGQGGADLKLRGEYQVKALYVDDGDTIDVDLNGQRVRIRLSDIDAPESGHLCSRDGQCKKAGQLFAKESGDLLRSFVMDSSILLNCTGYDGRWHRPVCRVYTLKNGVRAVDTNYELVAAGLAWFNEKYSKDNQIRQAENAARRNRVGLWQQNNPIAPWDWRKNCWEYGECQQ